jgi:aldose 1-epimerase
MVAPTGEQFLIAGGSYRAVVTESGATLRLLEHHGRPLIDGFADDEMPFGGRGQLLVPWVNRIRDGAYDFGGRRHQLALSEPARRNASHGLVRWVAWSAEEHTTSTTTLRYRLMAQTGYPWTLDLRVRYAVDERGLRVTQSAHNRADSPAPYAAGAHPSLTLGRRIDALELTIPAATRLLVDPSRKLPEGVEDVDGTEYDFRTPRTVGDTALDHAFTGLRRGDDGRATVVLRSCGPTSSTTGCRSSAARVPRHAARWRSSR